MSRITKVPMFEVLPEHAGETVGWACAQQPSEECRVPVVVAGHAIVGEHGASYMAQSISEEGIDSREIEPAISGFVGATAISIYCVAPNKCDLQSIQSPRYDQMRGESGREQRKIFDSFFPNEKPNLGKGEWALGGQNFIEAIKRQLTSINALDLFPAVYYNLAIRTLQPVGDASMTSSTNIVHEKAGRHLSDLRAMRDMDRTMLGGFTVFGGLEPSKVPDVFKDSRETVGAVERSLDLRLEPYMNSWFLPVGFRPSGRSWPYMNAADSDADRAYGRELDALKKRDIAPARAELEREIKEIDLRIRYAEAIHGAIGDLRQKEQELSVVYMRNNSHASNGV